jgi:glycosyltransferase involved in cell wall biosynthesis
MERSNLLRLKALMARGHDVELISLTPLGALAPLLEEAGIPATGLEYRGLFGWRSMRAMRRTFREHRADAILMTGHNLAATVCLLGIGTQRKVQAIHYHHREGARGEALKWRLIYRIGRAVFDRFTFCSHYIFDEAVSIAPLLRDKSTVVHNPFEMPPDVTAAERLAAKAAFGIAASSPVVGNAGWLVERKRFDVFLRTAAQIAKQRPDAVFLIAGDGSERPALEELAQTLGIRDKVRFLGQEADLQQFYHALDIVLFNSDFDALPRVPVEAAAAGVPVVASLLKGGLAEALRAPDEIVLFDRHDENAMAAAVVDLLGDDERRLRMAATARERIAAFGNVTAHGRAIEQLLEGLD